MTARAMVDERVVEQHTRSLVDCCRRLHARGLLAGAEGNCSVRLTDGSILITASGVDKAGIAACDIVRRHADGTEYHGRVTGTVPGTVTRNTEPGDSRRRPSSEMEMHLRLYADRPDIMAVVHAHPPAATGFATAGRSIPDNVLPELPVVIGPVALVPYGRPGTVRLSESMEPYISDHDVFLLSNHGVTAIGSSLEAALTRLESVEQAARILVVAELLGGARVLPDGEAEALAQLRRTTPQLPPDVLS